MSPPKDIVRTLNLACEYAHAILARDILETFSDEQFSSLIVNTTLSPVISVFKSTAVDSLDMVMSVLLKRTSAAERNVISSIATQYKKRMNPVVINVLTTFKAITLETSQLDDCEDEAVAAQLIISGVNIEERDALKRSALMRLYDRGIGIQLMDVMSRVNIAIPDCESNTIFHYLAKATITCPWWRSLGSQDSEHWVNVLQATMPKWCDPVPPINKKSHTPIVHALYTALESQNEEYVNDLLQVPALFTWLDVLQSIDIASQCGKPRIVTPLLNKIEEIFVSNDEATSIVKSCLKPVVATGQTSIDSMIQPENTIFLQTQAQNWEFMQWILNKSHLHSLVARACELHDGHGSLLHIMSQTEQPDIKCISALLSIAPQLVSIKDVHNHTALYYAWRYQCKPLFDLLLSKGCNAEPIDWSQIENVPLAIA